MKRYKSNQGMTKRCRCGRRTWETCVHIWYFNFTWKGQAERGPLGTSNYEQAQVKLAAIRAAMMNGTHVRKVKPVAVPSVGDQPTFETVAACYLQQHVQVKMVPGAAALHKSLVGFLSRLTVPPGIVFTAKPFRLITQEDIEMALAAKRQPTTVTVTKGEKTWVRRTGGHVAANRMHAHLSSLWNWAIQPKRAYAEKTPFSYGGRVPEELKKAPEHGRDRRLHPGEEDGLLAHAGEHLRDCIVAALESGMRKGELLSLQWKHVRWMQNEIDLKWQNTKTRQSRQIPISPALREVFVRRMKAHPKDEPWTPEHYVFGDEVGRRVKDIRTAWDNVVLKAHGIPVGRAHGRRLGADVGAKLREIDLHFHDLRHEAGSRKLEGGWPLHAVSRWLGHRKLTTTDTYLNATTQLLHELNERVPLRVVNG